MVNYVAVERGAETAPEAHRSKPRLWAGPWVRLEKMGLDDPQEHMDDCTGRPGLALQEVA